MAGRQLAEFEMRTMSHIEYGDMWIVLLQINSTSNQLVEFKS